MTLRPCRRAGGGCSRSRPGRGRQGGQRRARIPPRAGRRRTPPREYRGSLKRGHERIEVSRRRLLVLGCSGRARRAGTAAPKRDHAALDQVAAARHLIGRVEDDLGRHAVVRHPGKERGRPAFGSAGRNEFAERNRHRLGPHGPDRRHLLVRREPAHRLGRDLDDEAGTGRGADRGNRRAIEAGIETVTALLVADVEMDARRRPPRRRLPPRPRCSATVDRQGRMVRLGLAAHRSARP